MIIISRCYFRGGEEEEEEEKEKEKEKEKEEKKKEKESNFKRLIKAGSSNCRTYRVFIKYSFVEDTGCSLNIVFFLLLVVQKNDQPIGETVQSHLQSSLTAM